MKGGRGLGSARGRTCGSAPRWRRRPAPASKGAPHARRHPPPPTTAVANAGDARCRRIRHPAPGRQTRGG